MVEGECEVCGFGTEVTFTEYWDHKVKERFGKEGGLVCRLCRSTWAFNAHQYPHQYPNQLAVLKTLVVLTWTLIDEIRAARDATINQVRLHSK
jgi:hypothetical protein